MVYIVPETGRLVDPSEITRLVHVESGEELYVFNKDRNYWEIAGTPYWKYYVLTKFSHNMFTIPYDMVRVIGHRFCSHQQLIKDTVEDNGCIASATLSLLFKPRVIVEFGVKAGHTALLLCKLNPDARVHGVDIRSRLDHSPIPIGYVALMNEVKNWSLHIMDSAEFRMPGLVDFCFIDGEHTYEQVVEDNQRAWENRNTDRDWMIAWDDYHPTNEGVVRAVDEFCADVGYELQKAWSWYWIGTKTATEEELNAIGPD